MKKIGILNQPLSAAIAGLGHTDTLVIADAGLPIPPETQRVDLADEILPGQQGVPQTPWQRDSCDNCLVGALETGAVSLRGAIVPGPRL